MLLPSLWLWTSRLYYGPRMLPAANTQHVEVLVLNADIGRLAFDSSKHKDALYLDLLCDQVPLYLRQGIQLEIITLFVSNETHSARVDVSRTILWVVDL